MKYIIKTCKICKELGMSFIYRPHPGDDLNLLKRHIKGVKISSKKEKLSHVFKKGDIFISNTSTALIEAAMRSKVTIQLYTTRSSNKTENFEQLGICSKSVHSFTELNDYLLKIANSDNLDKFKIEFNNNFVDLSFNNPEERFLEILNEIEKSKKAKTI